MGFRIFYSLNKGTFHCDNLPHIVWQHVLLLGHVVTKCQRVFNDPSNIVWTFFSKEMDSDTSLPRALHNSTAKALHIIINALENECKLFTLIYYYYFHSVCQIIHLKNKFFISVLLIKIRNDNNRRLHCYNLLHIEHLSSVLNTLTIYCQSIIYIWIQHL